MNKSIITTGQANQLYKTLKFIHDAFVEHKITYFMVGGTLLGAVRNQGVIPWDDDGDLCVLSKDVPKLRRLIPYFEENGYELTDKVDDKASCLKRKDSCTWFASCGGKNCLGVDIFVMYEKKEKITYFDPYWETASNGGKACYFNKKHVYPLVPMRFGNFYLYGPQNPIQHLNTCYGEDWSSKGQVIFDHRRGIWKNTKKRNLKTQEFLSFKAPRTTKDLVVPPTIGENKQNFFIYLD